MLMLTIAQLFKTLSADEVKATIYLIAKALGLKTETWGEGDPTRTIFAVVAEVISDFTQVIVLAIKGGFLDDAEGAWLDLKARDYSDPDGNPIERIKATFAPGEITLTNTTGGEYTYDPGDLHLSAPTIGKTYTNTEGGTLLPSGTLTLDILADEAGSASSVGAGLITEIVSGPLGVTCTNAAGLVGLDEETDAQLRKRCRLSLGALSPFGPAAAYEFAALSARRADGSPCGITRVTIPTPPGDGSLRVIVATATGAVPGDVDDPNTDLGAVNAAIQRIAVPLVVDCSVESAVNKIIAVTCDVWISTAANLSDAAVQTLAGLKLQANLRGTPIGGYVLDPDPGKVFRNALVGAIESASPFIITTNVGTPAADVAIAEDEAPIDGLQTINVHQVSA